MSGGFCPGATEDRWQWVSRGQAGERRNLELVWLGPNENLTRAKYHEWCGQSVTRATGPRFMSKIRAGSVHLVQREDVCT